MSRNKPARQQGNRGVTTSFNHTSVYSGPLPPPAALEKYEQIKPGFAERIVSLSEGEAKHRRGVEHRVISYNFILTFIGQLFGLGAIGGVIYLCYYAFSLGHANQAASIAISVLVGIGGVFLWRKRVNKEE